jgi:hypothetical protein
MRKNKKYSEILKKENNYVRFFANWRYMHIDVRITPIDLRSDVK